MVDTTRVTFRGETARTIPTRAEAWGGPWASFAYVGSAADAAAASGSTGTAGGTGAVRTAATDTAAVVAQATVAVGVVAGPLSVDDLQCGVPGTSADAPNT